MARQRQQIVTNLADLRAHDVTIDQQVCGFSLAEEQETRFAIQGAHDASPTFYFVLEELFAHLAFDENTHLLDVGCSTGRVLAFFAWKGFAGKATGVELDPELAKVARSWTEAYRNLDVIEGSALDLDLDRYTDLYMFNPFAPWVLQKFIAAIEAQVTHPINVIHMADNGDSWQYEGRGGWTELASGTIQNYRNERGYPVKAYDIEQHYTIWHYEGAVG